MAAARVLCVWGRGRGALGAVGGGQGLGRRRALSGGPVPDYVVVGGGSAGAVLANRLSADHTVHLLEAGPPDVGRWDSWKIQMPAALTFNLADDRYNWAYLTEPQPHLDGRRIPVPRGRVLGGSSSLNAMVYIRGHALDYDRWEAQGAAGWAYKDCLPYFRKAQTHELGEDEYRGDTGPLHVSRGRDDCELFSVFVKAAVEAGYPYTADLNGFQQEGFGPMDMTVHNGRRWNTASAYLRPALARPTLSVTTGACVERVLFEGDRAVGVRCNGRDLRAGKEVLLCGGAINSPQLLLLSGIGDEAALGPLGIPVQAYVPGVGQNLQDHLDLYIQYQCRQPITLYHATWRFPHNMVRIFFEWLLLSRGKGATAHLESGGFIRSKPGVEHPDIQYHFLPGALTGQLNPGGQHAFQAHCSTMRPTSTGTVALRSSDARQAPVIDPRYLSTPEDVVDYRTGVRLTREIFEQAAFDDFRGDPISPGPEVQTDEDIDAWVRQNTESAYHPCGTCAMGDPDDPTSVVDPDGRVKGVRGLRVVDSSIMPSVVSGNLNAPTIMLAEKLADCILGRPALAPSTAPVYESPRWQTEQR